MNRELGNLAAYLKHAVKAVSHGRIREAWATAVAMGFRTVEALRDCWKSPRVVCPFCGWRGHAFRTFVTAARLRRAAVCPSCLSLERHRDFLLLFEMLRARLAPSIRLLDVAPTAAFAAYCRTVTGIKYVSVDNVSPIAMLRTDVQNLALSSETIDIVVCYHVLDYVRDDARALTEFRRVMKPGGVAILHEGVTEDRPTEEWHRAVPERQYRIRQYGSDFEERLLRAGFGVTKLRRESGPVFLATKAQGVLEDLGSL